MYGPVGPPLGSLLLTVLRSCAGEGLATHDPSSRLWHQYRSSGLGLYYRTSTSINGDRNIRLFFCFFFFLFLSPSMDLHDCHLPTTIGKRYCTTRVEQTGGLRFSLADSLLHRYGGTRLHTRLDSFMPVLLLRTGSNPWLLNKWESSDLAEPRS